jgi:hypothetical protein
VRPAYPKRWLFVSSTVCSAFALAGCGGSDGQAERRAPVLPTDLGELLVTETEDVSAALEAGDEQVARDEALELRQLVREAIDAGRVPKPLRAPLVNAVNRLVDSIEVPPPAAPPPPPAPEPPPEEPNCDELEELKGALEQQKDELDKDDPAREVVEDQLEAVKDELKACKKDGEEGEDGGDDG